VLTGEAFSGAADGNAGRTTTGGEMSNGEYEEVQEATSERGEELAQGGSTSSNSTSAPGGLPGDLEEDHGDELSGGTGSGGAEQHGSTSS
jgi:hypothetical protein